MTASIPTSHEALVSQPAAGQGTATLSPHAYSPTQRGVDAGSRLYEFWNAIFARAGAAADEQLPPAGPRLSSGNLIFDASQSSKQMQASGQSWFPAGNSVLLSTSNRLNRPDGADPVMARSQKPVSHGQMSGPSERPASSARNPSTRAISVSSEPDIHEPPHPAAIRPQPEEESPPPQRSNSSDSVSVFLHGAAVSIVVRDATISAREAIDCAFETARHLTGQRSALLRLTLNGQTLYQQQAADSHVQPALLFAC